MGARNKLIPDRRELVEARDRFAELLEKPNSLEREWQKLFEQYPFVLTGGLHLSIAPEELKPCCPGKAEPDFIFYPKEDVPLSPYGVIEIKRPQTLILTAERKDLICLSSDVYTAVRQAKNYAAEAEAKFAEWPSRMLVLGNYWHLFVIAGLSKDIVEKVKSDIQRKQLADLLPPNCWLVPFDMLKQYFESRVPPQLHVTVPWYPYLIHPQPIESNIPLSQSEQSPDESEFQGLNSFRHFGPREMHLAECSECGRMIGVPFEPSPGYAVLCRECHRKKRGF